MKSKLIGSCKTFVLPSLHFTIPDTSAYEKTRRQRPSTTRRKSTNDQNGPKRKSKNKRKTEITQDEQVSDTDTEQQTSKH